MTSRAASSAVKPARSSRPVRSAARLPSTAAGRPVPIPSQRIIWAAVGLQNCWTASPDTSPLAVAPAHLKRARSSGFSVKRRVVTPLQLNFWGVSKLRWQSRPTSPARAASSPWLNRARGSVTAARIRPKSSRVTAHSSGGIPREEKKAATRPDLYCPGCQSGPPVR